MKKIRLALFAAALTVVGSWSAFAETADVSAEEVAAANSACKMATARILHRIYDAEIVRTRVLRSSNETEVWAKSTEGDTYSVFFRDSSCRVYVRHIAW